VTIREDELRECLRILERSRELEPDDPAFLALENAAAHLRKHAKKRRKADRRRATAKHDRDARASAELKGGTPRGATTLRERACYVCKQPYRQVHDFYHLLCPTCGAASQAKRDEPIDLAGRRVLITGGRVKIGWATALRCLRAGAEVAVTTRFAADAAARFAAEPDCASWAARLTIHSLDFRRLADVLRAIEAWRGLPLDILINNAAQTVWHPPEHYAELIAAEQRESELPIERWTSELPALFAGVDTAIDLRRQHSWVMTLDEVPPVELVEAQVVNAIVPALLCSRLEPAFLRSRHPDRYIVNVAALEGQFERATKLARHPHTNMAKAALNMLVRTSAEHYASKGIYMIAVDPGWVSHEAPPHARARAEAEGFRPPLDFEDAAARILDPIARGLAGRPVYGVLLKDYAEAPW
jgi:NAD(P)-dependent dehydrogenase (short-subunit alcohol dehydrogenase family)